MDNNMSKRIIYPLTLPALHTEEMAGLNLCTYAVIDRRSPFYSNSPSTEVKIDGKQKR